MQVLLKYKKKNKGMPRYDPSPFTVTEMVGRQAVLKRGNTTLRRETQKFKRFHTNTHASTPDQAIDDEWEDGHSCSQSEVNEDSNPGTEESQHQDTGVHLDNSKATLAETDMTATDMTVQAEMAATVAPRRSDRPRAAPKRFGEWAKK